MARPRDIIHVNFSKLQNHSLTETDDDDDDYDHYIDVVTNDNLDLEQCSNIHDTCKEGLLIPLWSPMLELLDNDKYIRASLYIVGLIYMFIGLSVVTERFMTAIDVIISQKKQVPVMISDGSIVLISVRIWSQTVANATLVALGSSTSEILLTIIEIFSNDFQVGYIGLCAIISSAAYNLFIISAICVFAVPVKKVKKIKRLRFYWVTAAWSIIGYIWLLVIVQVTSKGVIEIWEAVLTLACFPATVFTVYIAEKRMPFRTSKRGVFSNTNDTKKAQQYKSIEYLGGQGEEKVEHSDIRLLQNAEKHRNEITLIIRKLRELNPRLSMMALTAMAKKEILNKEPKSRAFYGGTRKVNYWPQIMKETENCAVLNEEEYDYGVTKVFFESDTYAVLENARVVKLTVVRKDGDINKVCQVNYKTEEGTAKNAQSYAAAKGTVFFKPLQLRAQMSIVMISNNVVGEDYYFYVNLFNPQLRDASSERLQAGIRRKLQGNISLSPLFTESTDSKLSDSTDGKYEAPPPPPVIDVRLCSPYQATVTIVDPIHPGILFFPNTTLTVEESCGDLPIKVCRSKGGNGRIRLPYHSVDGTAKLGEHYQLFGSDVIFENQEYEKNIMMRIINKDRYKVQEYFHLALDQPEIAIDDFDPQKRNSVETSNDQQDKATLGANSVLTVNIEESKTFKSAVDNILNMKKPIKIVGPTTWYHQFIDAITVNTDVNYLPDDGDYRYLDLQLPTFAEYAFHFLSLTWKLFAALIPPTKYCNGWACVFACILELGILVTIIIDFASSLGCTLGLHDSVTAVSLVALGISFPDTFSSKSALINEAYADAAIGNVPACNAVGLFLGLGIAWTIAAIHHRLKGTEFIVPNEFVAPFAVLFCLLSFLGFSLFFARRWSSIQGELGGPIIQRILTSVILVFLWLVYVLVSVLIIFCVIRIF